MRNNTDLLAVLVLAVLFLIPVKLPGPAGMLTQRLNRAAMIPLNLPIRPPRPHFVAPRPLHPLRFVFPHSWGSFRTGPGAVVVSTPGLPCEFTRDE